MTTPSDLFNYNIRSRSEVCLGNKAAGSVEYLQEVVKTSEMEKTRHAHTRRSGSFLLQCARSEIRTQDIHDSTFWQINSFIYHAQIKCCTDPA